MNKIPIKLYYKEDGSILNQGGLNKIPLLTKLSNYVYELILVTPLMNSKYTLYSIFEKSDGTITTPYPMDYYGVETVKVGNQQQRWYKYKNILNSDVLNISSLNYNNQIKIGFRAEFNSGEVDKDTNESIVGVFNFIPTTAYCSYTINSRNVVIDNTPLKTIIDFINTGNAGKIDKSESILLTDVEPTLITDEGNPYYNLNYLYLFTSDTQNYKKGEIAKHTLNSNGESVLEKIPLYESVYSKYDETQKGNPTPRSIGERFGDVSNYLNMLNNNKVEKQEGKQLSTNDFSNAYKNKLDGIDENINSNLETTKSELKSYTDTKIADLINGSPETLDTLKELADAYQNNLDIINGLIAVLGNKANASDVYTKTETDNALQNKVDKVNGKSLVLNTEIAKLLTVEHNANHYVLPSDVPHDVNYVHTDNNFTNTEKQKLQALKNYDDSGIKQQINNVEANAKQYTNEQINELIGGASDSYNTLKELQDAFTENKDLIANLNELASKKVDKVDGKGLSTNDFTNEDKETLKFSAIPIYLKDYNYISNELIMGAINYTNENGLKSKLFFKDAECDSLLLVVNRWADYYEAINIRYLENYKFVYNIVKAPVTDSSLITISYEGQIVDTSGSGSGGSVDLSEVKSYIDEELGKIVDNAPEALNTLNELATAYTEQGEVVEALNSAINNKVDKEEGKQLSTNDYTDYDKQKVSNLPVSIEKGYAPQVTMKNAVTYVVENNLGSLTNAIVGGNTRERITVSQYGPGSWNAYTCYYYEDDYNSIMIGNDIRIDTSPENIEISYEKIIPAPTKTSELENDAGFVTKNIIPNELNSKFAISSSTEDLTANMTNTLIYAKSHIIRSMVYGNGIFVAVGGNSIIQYSTDNGNEWFGAENITSSDTTFTSVTYGKGTFACVEYIDATTSKLYKSYDGAYWELVQEFNQSIENILYVNGRFILVGSNGYISFTDDFINFTEPYSGIENSLISITYGKNKYVAVSNKGDVIYSLDGVVWNKAPIENDTTHYRVASYGKGMFIIGGQGGDIKYSYDGINWTKANVNSNLKSISYIRAMCYYNGKFFACLYGAGNSGTDGEILTSVDGITWDSNKVDENNKLWAICFGNELVLIGGDNGAIHKYNLNIEWLDYEPVIKANQVLWQKQYLTLSDGSIVESEVEVHTNMKQIYEEALYGKFSNEYPLKQYLSLDNKIIEFNKDFTFEYPGDNQQIILLEMLTTYLEEEIGYRVNGYCIVLDTQESHYTISLYKNYYEDGYMEHGKVLCENGNWLLDSYSVYGQGQKGYVVKDFNSSFTNLFKIFDKPESLKDRIVELQNQINSSGIPLYAPYSETDYYMYILEALQYIKNNYDDDEWFSLIFALKELNDIKLALHGTKYSIYGNIQDYINNYYISITDITVEYSYSDLQDTLKYKKLNKYIPGYELESNNINDALNEIISEHEKEKGIYFFENRIRVGNNYESKFYLINYSVTTGLNNTFLYSNAIVNDGVNIEKWEYRNSVWNKMGYTDGEENITIIEPGSQGYDDYIYSEAEDLYIVEIDISKNGKYMIDLGRLGETRPEKVILNLGFCKNANVGKLMSGSTGILNGAFCGCVDEVSTIMFHADQNFTYSDYPVVFIEVKDDYFTIHAGAEI